MRVLALTRYDNMGASSRMRVFQYIPELKKQGINVDIAPLFRDKYLERLYGNQPTNWLEIAADYFKQIFRLVSFRKYDLLWIEKELFPNMPPWAEQLFSFLKVPYIVDYDDAVFHNYDVSTNPFKKLLSKKIDHVMASSAVVTAGNKYIAMRAKKAGAKRIEYFPTVVDLEKYSVPTPSDNGKIVVGWIGSPSTVKYLDAVIPAIKTLQKEMPLTLHVVGAKFENDETDVCNRPWSEDTEVDEIKKFDIGIMPLVDSPWERGKCGFKLIQYMACAKPVVASPIGVNSEIVRNGENGYIATTTEQWVDALRKLANDKNMREAFGKEGRVDVEKKYCVQVTAPKLSKLMREIVGQGI